MRHLVKSPHSGGDIFGHLVGLRPQGVKPVTQRTVLKVCQLQSVSQGLRAKNRVVPVVGRVGLEPTTTEL